MTRGKRPLSPADIAVLRDINEKRRGGHPIPADTQLDCWVILWRLFNLVDDWLAEEYEGQELKPEEDDGIQGDGR